MRFNRYWLARIAYRKMSIESAVAHAQKAIQLDPAFMKAKIFGRPPRCY